MPWKSRRSRSLRQLAKWILGDRLSSSVVELPAQLDCVALEERVLLSATPFAPTVDSEAPDVDGSLDESLGGDEVGEHFLLVGGDEVRAIDASDGQPVDSAPISLDHRVWPYEQVSTELVVVDAGVEHLEHLLEDLAQSDVSGRSFEVLVLDPEHDGIEQITDYLQNHRPLDAIHLIAHGSSGELTLGTAHLTSRTLSAYSSQLIRWNDSLSDGADLLLYGCDLAATSGGRDLVDMLGLLVGADVAASTDLTGHESFQGDWDLEYVAGRMETQIAFSSALQHQWRGVLATIVVTTTDDVISGDADLSSVANLIANPGSDGVVSLREAVLAANAVPDADEIQLSPGDYYLTLTGGTDQSEFGDLDILADLTIHGTNARSTILHGTTDRLVEVADGVHFRLDHATLTSGNSNAGDGGALYVHDNATAFLDYVTIKDSIGSKGGAIYADGDITLSHVTLHDNLAHVHGGAIHVDHDGHATIISSTISNNRAVGEGGAIYARGELSIVNSTIAFNESPDTAGIYTQGLAPTTVVSSILHNPAEQNANQQLTSFGYNIDSDGTAQLGGTGDIIADPLLDASLANHGGETDSHALLTGSPAIDAGTFYASLSTDQRGFSVVDGAMDIGGYEASGVALSKIYWTDQNTNQILRADLDGSNVEVVLSGRAAPTDIAIDALHQKMYWTELSGGRIFSADLDGRNITLLRSGATNPNGIAVDPTDNNGGRVYWTEDGATALSSVVRRMYADGSSVGIIALLLNQPDDVTLDLVHNKAYISDTANGQIYRMNLNGTSPEVVVSGIDAPRKFDVDPVGGHIYWTSDGTTNSVFRSDLDGSNATAIITGLSGPVGLELDTASGTLYWTDYGTDSVHVANLDGSNASAIVTGQVTPAGIALAPSVPLTQNIFVVDTALDVADGNTASWSAFLADNPDGLLSLREAITLANNIANVGGMDEIHFAIPGAGSHTIQITGSRLPSITEAVLIDGYSQQGATLNTLDSGSNAVLMIDLNGTLVGGTRAGLTIDSGDGTTIRGLAINHFTGAGIDIIDSHSVTIEGNFIGTNVTGTIAGGNAGAGIHFRSGSQSATVGGITVGSRNIIAGNASHGIVLAGATTSSNSVINNLIGLSADAVTSLGNGGDGIRIEADAHNNTIGTVHGTGNLIAHNGGAGITVDGTLAVENTIRGNSIYLNGGLGIDLGAGTGVTANDASDADSGPNEFLNSPVLSAASAKGNMLRIEGAIQGSSNQIIRLDVYLTDGTGEGRNYLGTVVQNNGSLQSSSFIHGLSAAVSIGDTIVATATDAAGNTSEFSSAVTVGEITSGFLFSTEGNVSGSGIPGFPNWQEDTVLEFGGATMTLGESMTAGSFLQLFRLGSFGSASDINGMHYVSSNVTVGSGGGSQEFALREGDLLLTVNDFGTYTFSGSSTTISVDGKDVFVFRPHVVGDYSAGEFYQLLDNPLGDEIRGISLVETAGVQVGDAPMLQHGTFLLSKELAGSEDRIYTYFADTVGDGTTIGTSHLLLEGTDTIESANGGTLNFNTDVQGIHVVLWEMTLGGIDFAPGDLLITLDDDQLGPTQAIGSNGIDVRQHDIIRLRMSETRLGPNDRSIGEALIVFDGSEVGMNPGDINEDVDALTLVIVRPSNLPVSASHVNQTHTYAEDTAFVDLNDITIFDPDPTETVTVTLQLNNPTIGALTASSGNGEGYNSVTGIWSMIGSVDEVNSALAAIRFTPTADNTAPTTITVTIEDSAGNTVPEGIITLTVTPVDDPPHIDLDANDSGGIPLSDYGTSFNEGSGPVALVDINDATIDDIDSMQLQSMTVTITNLLDGASETLAALTSGTNITSTYSAGTLNLVGADTIANYQQVLRSITYNNASSNPNASTRIISFVAHDGTTSSNTASVSVVIIPQNDAPLLDLDGDNSSGATGANYTTTYTEGAGPVAVVDATDAALADVDNTHLASLTVTITNLLDGTSESLAAITSGTNITGSYSTGTLTLTGSDTVANYRQVLRSITYHNSSANPNATARVITLVTSDGVSNSNTATATVTVVPQNNAPTIDLDANNSSGATGANYTTTYIEGAGPVAIADTTDAALADVDNTHLASLTVTITNLLDGTSESLAAVTSGTNITGSYSAGTLTLTGSDTAANYRQVLRSITYHNSSANPNATARVITLLASDGISNSNTATATVTMVPQNNAPTIDLDANNSSGATGANYTTTYTEGAGPVTIVDATDAALADPDNTHLASLTVTITNLLDGTSESLAVITSGTNITGSYSTGTLTLTGSDTAANYRQVLRSITYHNSSANPNATARVITLLASDGVSNSNTATATVTLVPQNNAPTIDLDANDSSGATGANYTTTYTEGAGPVAIADATDAALADADNTHLASLTVTITNLLDGTSESLAAVTSGTNITGSYSAGTLTLTGSDTAANYRQVLRSITYHNSSANPNATARVITMLVSDGVSNSNTATATVTLVPQNDAPTIDLDANNSSGASGANYTTTYSEGVGPVAIADIADAVIQDVDDTQLTQLVIQIVNPMDGVLEWLNFSTTGTSITGTYSDGVLTLVGSDSIANYQQVLRTVTYENQSGAPNTATRSIHVIANDGESNSAAASASVAIQAVNNAPIITVPTHVTVAEDSRLILSGIRIADSDIGDDSLRVTFQTQHGRLALDTTISQGIAASDISRSSWNTLQVTASLDQITTTLNAGGLSYVGSENYSGSDELFVTVVDAPTAATQSVSHTVSESGSIEVTPVNDAPVATGDALRVDSGNAIRFRGDYLLSNDRDVDGDTLAVQIVRPPQFGQFQQQVDGSFVYIADPQHVGNDSFAYRATDGTAFSTEVLVAIEVQAVAGPAPPVIQDTLPKTSPTPLDQSPPEPSVPVPTPTSSPTVNQLPTSEDDDDTDEAIGPNMHNDVTQTINMLNHDSLVEGMEVRMVISGSDITSAEFARSLFVSQFNSSSDSVGLGESGELKSLDIASTYADMAVTLAAGQLWDKLDVMTDELLSAPDLALIPEVSTTGVTTAFTVGYVMWLLKGGQLLTSLLAQMPAWQMMDPLPVLNGLAKLGEDETDDEDEDDSLQSLLRRSDHSASEEPQELTLLEAEVV